MQLNKTKDIMDRRSRGPLIDPLKFQKTFKEVSHALLNIMHYKMVHFYRRATKNSLMWTYSYY